MNSVNKAEMVKNLLVEYEKIEGKDSYEIRHVKVIVTEDEVIIIGNPVDGEESGLDENDWHNCDEMGCGCLDHVIARFPINRDMLAKYAEASR